MMPQLAATRLLLSDDVFWPKCTDTGAGGRWYYLGMMSHRLLHCTLRIGLELAIQRELPRMLHRHLCLHIWRMDEGPTQASGSTARNRNSRHVDSCACNGAGRPWCMMMIRVSWLPRIGCDGEVVGSWAPSAFPVFLMPILDVLLL